MPSEKKDQRVTIMMSPSELQQLDDWAFEARIRSRGEAIRRLLAAAIKFSQKHGELPVSAATPQTGSDGRGKI